MPSEASSPGEQFIVLQDADGSYFVLPRQTVESGRVADESTAALEALLRAEVSGYGAGIAGTPALATASTSELSARGIIVIGGIPALTNAGIIIIGGRRE